VNPVFSQQEEVAAVALGIDAHPAAAKAVLQLTANASRDEDGVNAQGSMSRWRGVERESSGGVNRGYFAGVCCQNIFVCKLI
jgi:hypothetical protein